MRPYIFLKDFLYILPAALLLGTGLAAVQGGAFLIGWMGFSVLLLAGLVLLTASWRWAGTGRMLAWMIGLAFVLRLLAGISVFLALPVYGYNAPDDKAGYVFTDAHRRDEQAWELAISNKPVLSAFDRTFYTDQYGGLLFVSALAYRYLSPDVQRPLLIILLAALAAALGVPFLERSSRLLWGGKLAAAAAWLYVLYPESVLTGGAQMREPFLLSFSAISLWGFADWLKRGERHGWVWMGLGLAGMLLVSPAVALVTLLIFAGWFYLRGERKGLSWKAMIPASAVFILALFLLSWSLNRQHDFGTGSPVGVILDWFRAAVQWDIYQLERGSGWVQFLLRHMNTTEQILFVMFYGIFQPVLPATFTEPTLPIWRVIAVTRALGWYILLPFLIFSLRAAWRTPHGPERRVWLWISAACWIWVVVCSLRGGADQWDNPRYRLILLVWQSLAAGYAWVHWRTKRDPWLPRIVAVEALGVLIFLQWYLSRYYHLGVQLPFFGMIGLIVGAAVLIIGGGAFWDWRSTRVPRLTHK